MVEEARGNCARAGLAHGIRAGDDDKRRVASHAYGLTHFSGHELLRHHVFQADVMVCALGQNLVFDLDRGESGCLRHADGVMHVHRVMVRRLRHTLAPRGEPLFHEPDLA